MNYPNYRVLRAVDPTEKEVTDMFDDIYGTCLDEPCRCRLIGPWLGKACSNWKPTGAKSWGEYIDKLMDQT